MDFGRTRLVLEPEAAWRNLSTSPTARVTRSAVVVAAVALAVVGLLVLSSVFHLLGGEPPTGSQSPTPSPSVSTSPQPSLPPSSVAASASVLPVSVAETPTAAPTPRTYVVQEGDTLNLIAQRFGTTVAAIQAANGLSGTDINIGQVLIIP